MTLDAIFKRLNSPYVSKVAVDSICSILTNRNHIYSLVLHRVNRYLEQNAIDNDVLHSG